MGEHCGVLTATVRPCERARDKAPRQTTVSKSPDVCHIPRMHGLVPRHGDTRRLRHRPISTDGSPRSEKLFRG